MPADEKCPPGSFTSYMTRYSKAARLKGGFTLVVVAIYTMGLLYVRVNRLSEIDELQTFGLFQTWRSEIFT